MNQSSTASTSSLQSKYLFNKLEPIQNEMKFTSTHLFGTSIKELKEEEKSYNGLPLNLFQTFLYILNNLNRNPNFFKDKELCTISELTNLLTNKDNSLRKITTYQVLQMKKKELKKERGRGGGRETGKNRGRERKEGRERKKFINS